MGMLTIAHALGADRADGRIVSAIGRDALPLCMQDASISGWVVRVVLYYTQEEEEEEE